MQQKGWNSKLKSKSKSKSNAETQRDSRVCAGRDQRAAGRRRQTNNTEGRVHVAECVTRSVWQTMAVFEGLVVWLSATLRKLQWHVKGPEPTHVMAPGSPGSPESTPNHKRAALQQHSVSAAVLAWPSQQCRKQNLLMSTILRISWCCSVLMQSTYWVFLVFVIPYFDFSLSPYFANTLTELPFSENVGRQLPAAVTVCASPPTGRCSGL